MSFILDALKKSENERQQVAPAEFATVAAPPAEPAAPRWLWVLGALLLVNLVVVLGLLLRPDSPSPPAVLAAPAAAGGIETAGEPARVAAGTTDAPAAAVPATFSDRVAEARRNQPTPPATSSRPAATTVAVGAGSTDGALTAPAAGIAEMPAEPGVALAGQSGNTLLLPTFMELRANGTLAMPDLHIDIHVYDPTAAKRFVFINMNKYREGGQLSEGPVVREITPEGVVLRHQGREFLLPRE